MGWAIFTVFLALLPVCIHEMGHAWALLRFGVQIEEISLLGIRIPRVPYLTFRHTFKGAAQPTAISMHPLLIGAYVKADRESQRALSLKDQVFVYGAGPFVNFVYSLVVFALLFLIDYRENTSVMAGICAIGALLLLLFRTFFCRYGVLAFGVVSLVFTIGLVCVEPQQDTRVFGGPVTIAKEMSGLYKKKVEQTGSPLRVALLLSAVLSLALGVTNAFPIPPLDGGQMANLYMGVWSTRLQKWYTTCGVLIFFGILVASLYGDVLTLFGK